MKVCHRTACLLLVVAVLLPGPPQAAESAADGSEPHRPRIGLVLGGGGARGATHIGVIRELERMRIPIDAVVGTSMGAFVGGLYAAGLTADELEQVATSVDWAAMMSDRPKRENLEFRRKEGDGEFPIDFEIGVVGREVRMPMGLVQGHRFDMLLQQLTIDVAHIQDFDRLPVPFRAVASDIEKGEIYVIDHGSLADAMRASMSVPGILAPTRVDGRLLADGGLFANLPIDVIRDMDVDVIIAVSAEFPLYAPDELNSALRISEQMLTILLRNETQRQMRTLAARDILIEPDLDTFASTNFAAITDTIDPGSKAALALADKLQQLSVDESVYADYMVRRSAARDRTAARLAFVRIVHDGSLSDAALQSRVDVKAGDAADPSRLAAAADRLYGLDVFEQVNYQLVEEDGKVGVVYEATAKSWGRRNLRFGLSLADSFDGTTAFNLKSRLTWTGINRRGAESRSDLQLGTDPALRSEFYQPLSDSSHWFIAPQLQMSRYNRSVFVDAAELARLRIGEAELGVDLGRRIRQAAEFRIGLHRGVGDSKITIGDPMLGMAAGSFDTGGITARLGVDTLDDALFPRHGRRAELRWQGARTSIGSDASYDTYSLDLEVYRTRGRSTLMGGISYGTTDDPAGAIQDLFELGGFLRLSGLEQGALSGPHAALARLVYRRRVGGSVRGLFDVPAYVGASLAAGNVWESRADIGFDSALINGSLFFGLDTYVGPVFLAAGFGESGDRNYYLFIGAPPR